MIQAEFARYVITTGDTYLRALNRMPGKIRPRLHFWGHDIRGKDAIYWPIWLGLIGFIPGLLTSGGIIGGAGQALSLLIEPLVPGFDGRWATILAAAIVMLLLWTGRYRRIEMLLIPTVIGFSFLTIFCAILMQNTEYQATLADIVAGLQFEFPLDYLVLALGMYGATGVASSEIAAYTYWCVERGYPSFIGGVGRANLRHLVAWPGFGRAVGDDSRHRIDRVTTRSGDDGGTSLVDGNRYRKYDAKIELVGALDEANSWLGLLAAETEDADIGERLHTVQSRLFDIGAVVAGGSAAVDWSRYAAELAAETAAINDRLPPLVEFILPGGGRAAATAHVARTVVRRAERRWWRAADTPQELERCAAGVYLNRLSDYLFVLARVLAASERQWRPLKT